MPARPKQHHFVTRAYLAGFLEPGNEQLFCFGRHRGAPFRRKPDELAQQRNYYSFKRADGTWDDRLEELIQKHVEDPGLEVIRRLTSGKTRLSWKERDRLCLFIAAQRFRVPYFRDMADARYRDMIMQLLESHAKKTAELGEDPGPLRLRLVRPWDGLPEQEATFVTKEQLEHILASLQEDPASFSRESFMDFAFHFSRPIRYMKWTVFHAIGNQRFMTSDCPVVMQFANHNLPKAGMVRPDCEIHFPLSGTSLLAMVHDLRLIEKLNKLGPTARAKRMLERLPQITTAYARDPDVEQFNLVQADFAARWVYSGCRNDWLIERLKRASSNVHDSMAWNGQLLSFSTVIGNLQS